MKSGHIKILFNNNQTRTISVSVADDEELSSTAVWITLARWWMRMTTAHHMQELDDGSVLLLARNQITSILLTPNSTLDLSKGQL